MTWTEKDGFKLIENQLNANDADTVAVANFTNAINQTGWSYLEVTTYPQFPDKVQVGDIIICHLSAQYKIRSIQSENKWIRWYHFISHANDVEKWLNYF